MFGGEKERRTCWCEKRNRLCHTLGEGKGGAAAKPPSTGTIGVKFALVKESDTTLLTSDDLREGESRPREREITSPHAALMIPFDDAESEDDAVGPKRSYRKTGRFSRVAPGANHLSRLKDAPDDADEEESNASQSSDEVETNASAAPRTGPRISVVDSFGTLCSAEEAALRSTALGDEVISRSADLADRIVMDQDGLAVKHSDRSTGETRSVGPDNLGEVLKKLDSVNTENIGIDLSTGGGKKEDEGVVPRRQSATIVIKEKTGADQQGHRRGSLPLPGKDDNVDVLRRRLEHERLRRSLAQPIVVAAVTAGEESSWAKEVLSSPMKGGPPWSGADRRRDHEEVLVQQTTPPQHSSTHMIKQSSGPVTLPARKKSASSDGSDGFDSISSCSDEGGAGEQGRELVGGATSLKNERVRRRSTRAAVAPLNRQDSLVLPRRVSSGGVRGTAPGADTTGSSTAPAAPFVEIIPGEDPRLCPWESITLSTSLSLLERTKAPCLAPGEVSASSSYSALCSKKCTSKINFLRKQQFLLRFPT